MSARTSPLARSKAPLDSTPSVGGYIFAGAVAVVVGSFLIALILIPWTEPYAGAADFLVRTGIIAVIAAAAALVLGSPLTALAHSRLRSVVPQWIHIAVFAGVGAVLGGLTIGVALHGLYPAGLNILLITAVAVACAAGRLAVAGRRWRYTFPIS